MVLAKTRSIPALHRYLIGFAIGAGLSVLAFVVLSVSYRTDEGFDTNEASFSLDPNSDTEPGSVDTDAPYDLPQLRQYESDFARSTALYSLIYHSNREELVRLVELARDISHDNRRRETLFVIGQRLAELGPKSALEFAVDIPHPQGNSLITGIFREWSLTNLEDLVEQAKFLEEPLRYEAMKTILETRSDLTEGKRREIAATLGREEYAIRSIAEQTTAELIANPEAAWRDLIDDEFENAYQIRSLERVVWHWVESDGIEVLSQIVESLSDNNRSIELRNLLVQNVTRFDVERAFEYVTSSSDETVGDLVWVVVGEWARVDPWAALEAIESSDLGSDRGVLASTVISEWAMSDPDELLAEIDQFDQKYWNQIAERVVMEIGRTNPRRAAGLLEDLAIKIGSTSNIANSLAYRWSQIDPRAALEWIMSETQVNNPKQPAMIEDALVALAREDPEDAFALAMQQPIHPDLRRGMESRVIAEVAEVDIDSALTLLPQVRDESKSDAVFSVARALVAKQDASSALKLAELLPESARNDYFETIGRVWAFSNALHMFEMLDQIANQELRSILADQLAFAQRHSPMLTDEQLEYVQSQVKPESVE